VFIAGDCNRKKRSSRLRRRVCENGLIQTTSQCFKCLIFNKGKGAVHKVLLHAAIYLLFWPRLTDEISRLSVYYLLRVEAMEER
jgi:hypothetical protein